MPPWTRRLLVLSCCSSPSLVLQPVALTGNLHDVGMVEQSIEHGGSQGLVVGKGASPLGKRKIAGQDHAASLITLGDDIEKEVRLVPSEGQVTDFVDDQ